MEKDNDVINANKENEQEKEISIQEKIIKRTSIMSVIGWIILLFIFIINACIYSNEIKLTNERIYLIL